MTFSKIPMMTALILGLFLVAALPSYGEENEPVVEGKQVGQVEAQDRNKQEALKELDKKEEKLVEEFEAGNISDEEFIEKLSAVEAAQKRLTKEERDRHWEEQRRLMREQTKGYE
ncbi:MAG: hypothetical protein LBV79_11530 [Candidatus Adiutrix sp.]|jgi:hypothetical protein|nr:hypothetical protein [Candidatus Adiutrix sp.]